MAQAMGANAYGKEPCRGERVTSRRVIDLRTRNAFLRPYGACVFPDRFHRAYALGYFLAPLTGLGIVQAQD